jgi:hypothetical protein
MVNAFRSTEIGSSEVSQNLHRNELTAKLLLGVAALALGQALQISFGFLSTLAIGWLTLALICAAGSMIPQRLAFLRISQKALWFVFLAGLALQIVQLLTTLPGIYIAPAYIHQLRWFQASVIIGGVCALLSLTPRTWFPLWVRLIWVGLVFFAILSAGVWVIRASPHPSIDTYEFQQTSSEALLRGQNPYELNPPNIYGNMRYYGEALVKDGKLTIGNPYPPLSIYLSWLGYAAAGDIRYSHLVAVLIAGVLMVCLNPGREALLAMYILLFTPRIFFVIEQSWTEPLVLLCSVAVVWFAQHRPAWKFIFFGLLIASKQYMILIFPVSVLLNPIASSRIVWARAWGWALGIAFAVTAPLAFWNFPAFLWNVGWAQWYQTFRLDSLSYAALYAHAFNRLPSQLLSFVVLGLALLLFWRYGTRSPSGFVTAMALGLELFFAFSKQAFCNYYFLVIGLLCCALAALSVSDNLFGKPALHSYQTGH